jgi:MYXO-CTERM domain-containing protein
LGGPVSFAFFDRQGFLLQRLNLAKAEDKSFLFQSDLVNIAGLQITHEDPRGLEFVGLRFGITPAPAPAPMALVLTGLAALGLARRPTRRQGDRIPDRLTPGRDPSLTSTS